MEYGYYVSCVMNEPDGGSKIVALSLKCNQQINRRNVNEFLVDFRKRFEKIYPGTAGHIIIGWSEL